MTVDPRRAVRAVLRHVFDVGGGAPDGIDAEPGVCQPREPYRGETVRRLAFACPGCGSWGSIACGSPKPTDGVGGQKVTGPTWDIAGGTLDDPSTLSLSPSIHCVGCCGWHGYLTAGEFKPC